MPFNRRSIIRCGLCAGVLLSSLTVGVHAKKTQLPDNSKYVTVKDGHIELHGKRVRFWATTGANIGKNHAENRIVVSRLHDLGFNMVRFWEKPHDYTKGDGSRGDLIDHFVWCCAQKGMKIWYAGLNRLGEISPSDADIVPQGADKEEWKKAVQKLSHKTIRNNHARYWDERIHRLGIERMKEILNHKNQYTGYRYADDPVFAVWELSNEEWWFHEMKRGQYLDMPTWFTRSLQQQWNEWLQNRYDTHKALSREWMGNCIPGEDLKKQNILLAPLLGEITDKQAASLGVGVAEGSKKSNYSHRDFNDRRGADVVRFLLHIWLSHKQEQENEIEKTGKSVRLAPTVWDNGVGWGLQTQFMQQHADAVSHDSYFNGAFTPDSTHKRFPWMSMLEELPKISWIDPWLEQNKAPDKPFFVYETQIMKPAKYRADYPMNLVRCAAIQDWDIITWHYWGFAPDTADSLPWAKPLNYPKSSHPTQGYHFQYDEVQQSAMTAAAEIFKNGHLHPPENPTTFTFGAPSLYSWDMNGYGETGEMFVPTTYRYGMRLFIDSTLDKKVVVEGPRIKGRGIFEPCPVEPTPQISHDWQRGGLVFDAPGTAMFCGFLANYDSVLRFNNGVTLKDVVFNNPEGMPYPVTEDEKYCEFSIVSTDDRPLAETDTAYVSLVSTSFNAGFEIDHDTLAQHAGSWFKEWALDLNAVTNPKGAEVLVCRVGARVELPMCKGMRYSALDWHLREVASGTISENEDGIPELVVPEDKPIFLFRLTRE